MKAYWKIPKEWVQEWGLSGLEAILLADIKSWDKPCTLDERAVRCGMSKNGVRKALENIAKKVPQSSTDKVPQSVLSKVHKVAQKKYTKCTNESTQSVQKVPQSSTKLKEKKENSPTPPIKNKKETIEELEDITLNKLSVPNADASADKKTSTKKKKKYTDEEIKLHGELKAIFCEEWMKTHGEEFYWGPAAMSATIKIADQIKFYMPPEQKNDTEQLKFNFRFFVQKIFTSQDNWLRTNATPQVIASKFNEIYTSLKNGKPRQQQQTGPTDDFLRRVAAEVEANGGLAF